MFNYQDTQLYAEAMPIKELAARYGTPCYIYSQAALIQQWQAFAQGIQGTSHQLCYAVKANSNLAILQSLARLDAGFDIVSGGELERVLAAGGNPQKIIFSGVGKQYTEIVRALEVGIACFNVESAAELTYLNDIAGTLKKRAAIALRVNPDVAAGGHAYITTGGKENKFGIAFEEVLSLYQLAKTLPQIQIRGMAYHIGSQLLELEPFLNALDRILSLLDELTSAGISIEYLDVGGGLGVRYANEMPPSPSTYMAAILAKLKLRNIKLIFEPGRAIVANAGILLTRVMYLKHTRAKNFAIVDAAMNDLLRPALYHAWQNIIPVEQRTDMAKAIYDVVGPVCETGDFLGKERELAIAAGDLLAIQSAGAYGFVMSSNYNSRPRAAEVLVDGKNSYLIRRRETIAELFAGEFLLP